jgi:hypothetical protein
MKYKIYIALIFIFSYKIAFPQNINSIPLKINKGFELLKIIWVENGKYGVVAENKLELNTFTHTVFIVDSSGAIVHQSPKFTSTVSCLSDYFFTLGKSCFFMKEDKNDMGGHQFYISSFFSGIGILDDTLKEIFYITEGKENKNLIEPSYNFQSIEGVHHRKAILIYNNNYKDPIPEGFRFRIVDENGILTPDSQVNFPYIDRACNIINILYDDEINCLYFLCNIFSLANDKERSFQRSAILIYNLETKAFNEIPLSKVEFENAKVQNYSDSAYIGFTGIKLNTSLRKCESNTAIINPQNNQLLNENKLTIDSGFVNLLLQQSKKNGNYSFDPLNFNINLSGDVSFIWTKTSIYNSDLNPEKGAAIIASTILFGLFGGILASSLISENYFINHEFAISGNYNLHSEFNTIKYDSCNLVNKIKLKNYFIPASWENENLLFSIRNSEKDLKSFSMNLFNPAGSCMNCQRLQTEFKNDFLEFILPFSNYSFAHHLYFIGIKREKENSDKISLHLIDLHK